MTEENILLDIDEDGVAHVTLNRPDVRNAFDEDTILRLTEIFDELGSHNEVVAVVLRGEGKTFCAGGDINWMKRAACYSEEENKQDALKLATMLNTLYNLPKLTIACVQGAAMGGGFGLVCCCDIVIADEDTKFALSEVKLGLIPATIGPYVIAAIGLRQSRRYFQTGESFTGKEAYDIGLVHKLAKSPEDMLDHLYTILKELAGNGPQAMMAAKKICLDMAANIITPDVIDNSATCIAHIRSSDEAREGLSAFLEKRKAAW